MPIADTYSGLQAAADSNDAGYRSGLDSALSRLMAVAAFRNGKQQEDQLKERQFQFTQQQYKDQLVQQALANARNDRLDEDAYQKWNATLDSNEAIKSAAVVDKADHDKQVEDDRRLRMAMGLLNTGQITHPEQLGQFQLAPHDQDAAIGVLRGLATEGANREATDRNTAQVAALPVLSENADRSARVIRIGKQAQAWQDHQEANPWIGLLFGPDPLPPAEPGPTTRLTPLQASNLVAPRIDQRQLTIDASSGMPVPIYRSPFILPPTQGTITNSHPAAQAVDFGAQVMKDAQDAIARGADPVAVRQRVQQLLSQ